MNRSRQQDLSMSGQKKVVQSQYLKRSEKPVTGDRNIVLSTGTTKQMFSFEDNKLKLNLRAKAIESGKNLVESVRGLKSSGFFEKR